MAERRDDLQHHLGGEGVHPGGPVQRQQRDALLLVEANLVEAHPSLSLPLRQGRKRRRRRQALVDVNVKISARAPATRRMTSPCFAAIGPASPRRRASDWKRTRLNSSP